MHSFLNQSLAGAVLFSLTSIAHASQYSALYSFGDSLSDTGNAGRWVYNGNPTWLDALAASQGTTAIASASGGNNYATGGATAAASNNANPANTTGTQINTYLTTHGGRADPNALYTLWIGGNDLLAAAIAASGPGGTAAGIADVTAGAAAFGQQLGQLTQAGAKTIMVLNAPDVGITPAVLQGVLSAAGLNAMQISAIQQLLNATPTPTTASRSTALATALTTVGLSTAQVTALVTQYNASAAGASQLSKLYNMLAGSAMAQSGANIIWLNSAGLLNDVINNPARYGFANSLGALCPYGTSANQCTSTTPGVDISAAFLFSDSIHPSPAAQMMVAQYAIATMQAPYLVGRLPDLQEATAQSLYTQIDSRLQQLHQTSRPVGSVGAFGGYGGKEASDDGSDNSLTIGVDAQLTTDTSMGLAVLNDTGSQRLSSLSTHTRSTYLAGFFSHHLGNAAWLDGSLHLGITQYNNINRQFTLNTANIVETGNTKGTQLGARLGAGWLFNAGPVQTGPIGEIRWSRTRVAGYAEDNQDAASMQFNGQDVTSTLSALGWQVQGQIGMLSPYVKARWNHEFNGNTRTLSASILGAPVSFSTAVYIPDTDWMQYDLGTLINLSKNVSAYLSVTATSGHDSGNSKGVSLGLGASF